MPNPLAWLGTHVPLGVEYQVAFTLPARRGHVLAIALSRGERDYSEARRRVEASGPGRYVLLKYVPGLGDAGDRAHVVEAEHVRRVDHGDEQLVALHADGQELVVPGEGLLDELHRRFERGPGGQQQDRREARSYQ